MGKKNSFAIHFDDTNAVEHLPDSLAGEIFKGVIGYSKTGDIPVFSSDAVKALFLVFKSRIDDDRSRYDALCSKYSQNAKRRYAKKCISDEKVSSEMKYSVDNGIKDIDTSFDAMWSLYGVAESNRDLSTKLWGRLSTDERKAVMAFIPQYKSERCERDKPMMLHNFLRKAPWRCNGNTMAGK